MSAGPAEEQAARDVEHGDNAQRLGAEHGIHAADAPGKKAGGVVMNKSCMPQTK